MSLLPPEFGDLEEFAGWCLATENERYQRRVNSTLQEMQAFYDAIVPRAEDAIEFCDQHPFDALPDAVTHLMWMLHSMVMVSFPVEVWLQPRVPDTGASTLICVGEPAP